MLVRFLRKFFHSQLFQVEKIILYNYHITMATILRTASFRLWQKFTKALPFGPILPNIIPVKTKKNL